MLFFVNHQCIIKYHVLFKRNKFNDFIKYQYCIVHGSKIKNVESIEVHGRLYIFITNFAAMSRVSCVVNRVGLVGSVLFYKFYECIVSCVVCKRCSRLHE